MKTLEYKVEQAHDGHRLDKFLSAVMAPLDASRRKIRDHIDEGAVYIDKKRVHISSRALEANQIVQIHWDSGSSGQGYKEPSWDSIQDLSEILIAETDDFYVINKPRGLPCQATKTSSKAHAGSLMKRLCEKEPYLVHRIDQWTSGALVYAKTKKAMLKGMEQFKKREVRKTYHCIAVGKSKQSLEVKEGAWKELQHNLLKPDQSTMTVQIVGWRDKRGKKAILKVREIGQLRTEERIPLCLLEVALETGRTHQIRVQLAAVDLPLLGDKKYGSISSAAITRGPGDSVVEKGQYLHARKISIPALKIRATAPYPATWTPMIDSFMAQH